MLPLNKFNRKYYDYLVGTERDINAQINWFDKLFKKYGVKTVLDCGCGTGTHAIMLAKKGYKITAFDYSTYQLKQAREKAKKAGVKINFKQGDIRNFYFGNFDAVISLYAVIMFACKDKKELTAAVKCMKTSLNPRGIAFLETCTSQMLKYPELVTSGKCIDQKAKVAEVEFRTNNKREKYTDMQRVFLVKEKDKNIQVTETYARNKYFDKNDVLPIFKALNLKLIKLYGTFIKEKRMYEDFNKNSGFISPLFKINRQTSKPKHL